MFAFDSRSKFATPSIAKTAPPGIAPLRAKTALIAAGSGYSKPSLATRIAADTKN
jgi:hypothetical protein